SGGRRVRGARTSLAARHGLARRSEPGPQSHVSAGRRTGRRRRTAAPFARGVPLRLRAGHLWRDAPRRIRPPAARGAPLRRRGAAQGADRAGRGARPPPARRFLTRAHSLRSGTYPHPHPDRRIGEIPWDFGRFLALRAGDRLYSARLFNVGYTAWLDVSASSWSAKISSRSSSSRKPRTSRKRRAAASATT